MPIIVLLVVHTEVRRSTCHKMATTSYYSNQQGSNQITAKPIHSIIKCRNDCDIPQIHFQIYYSALFAHEVVVDSHIKLMVLVFSSHSFWTSMDVPAGVTQEEGQTGFFIHLLPAVRAFIFLARRIAIPFPRRP